MGVGSAVPNPPQTGTPVRSTWGNYVSTHVVQAYASKTALDAGWPDAPEGAYAVTTDTFRLWQRRGGVWAPPLSGPLGMVVGPNDYPTSTNVTVQPGIWYSETPVGPFNLLVNRLYQVSWSVRWQNVTAGSPTTAIAIIGGDVSAAGTGDDKPFEGGGVGQQALVYGYTLSGNGAATRQSTAGFFHTKGAAGAAANATVPVTIAHRYLGSVGGTNGTFNVSLRRLALIDQGPWPAVAAV